MFVLIYLCSNLAIKAPELFFSFGQLYPSPKFGNKVKGLHFCRNNILLLQLALYSQFFYFSKLNSNPSNDWWILDIFFANS